MIQNLLLRVRAAVADARQRPLLSKAVSGSFFTIGSGIVVQGLKFLVSLALTRLLLPADFGLVALVMFLSQGLRMLSDIGIGPSVVQSPRGDQPVFLRTAWSLQVTRGLAIGVVSLLIAWPGAVFFKDRRLLYFVPVIGLQAVLSGFNATTLFLLARHLHVGKRALLDLLAYVFSIPVMIAWAWLSPTPWALVGGALAETVFLLAASFWIEPRSEHRFKIDRDEAHGMIRFGRWVFLSTAFTFLAMRLGPPVLARAFPDKESLGLFNVAMAWSGPVVEMLRDLASKVLFPLFARWSDNDRSELRRKIFKTRLVFGVLTTGPLLLIALLGPWLVTVLYKPVWWSAGPMLRCMAAGGIGACATATLEPALLSLGDSFRYMIWQLIRFAITFVCGIYGLHVAGSYGFVVGTAWANLMVAPILMALIRSHGLLTPLLDGVFLAVGTAALLLLR
jgi:O-antigen/teichoic acid export membrane protein